MPKHNPNKLTQVTIEVTQSLINMGTPNDTLMCPVALALKKVLAKKVDLIAEIKEILLSVGSLYVLGEEYDEQGITTPARVAKFMQKMDKRDIYIYEEEGQPDKLPPLPKPFSFKLKIRNKFLRPGLRT